MCQFLSLIVTKSGKIYGDGSYDQHERLIEDNEKKDKELIDDKNPPYNTFARVEVVPIDKNIFNHKLSNWEVKVDERIKPEWWNFNYDKKCINRLKKVFKEQFLIGGEYETIDKDYRFLKDVKIGILKSKIGEMWGNSSVGEMLDNSSIGKMWDNSSVGRMWENSSVGKMLDSPSVGKMLDSPSVGKMLDNSSVGEMRNSSSVGRMWDNSSVGRMWENSSVGEMLNSSSVGKMLDNSSVGEMLDNSSVGEMWDNSSVGRRWVII